ncbi:MAG: hypothetical protein IPJ88_09005 [Myxococcales bacterium]|nr:MAG: hypothetical protein IPJ88_09005 [Myxococcales bacterium]
MKYRHLGILLAGLCLFLACRDEAETTKADASTDGSTDLSDDAIVPDNGDQDAHLQQQCGTEVCTDGQLCCSNLIGDPYCFTTTAKVCPMS